MRITLRSPGNTLRVFCISLILVTGLSHTSIAQAASFSGQVGLQSDVYFQNFPLKEGTKTSLTSVVIDFQSTNTEPTSGWKHGFELGALVSSEKDIWSLYVPELYGGMRFGSDSKNFAHQLSIGRKHLGLAQDPSQERKLHSSWSELDSRWDLGIFEPRYRYDYLRPVSQGLTGVFYEAQVANESSGVWQVSLFGSGVTIPEQGAPVSFENGKCNTLSPWFTCPSSETLLLNQSTSIQYNLNVPPLNKLLLGKWAGGARVGYETPQWRISGSYAYKPVNQIGTSFEAISYLDTPEVAIVNIYPRVLYHHVGAGDFSFGLANVADVWVSVVGESPGSDEFSSELTTQKLTNAMLISGGVDLEVTPSWIAQLSYLNVQGGHGEAVGPLIRESSSPFDARYTFSNAVRIGSRSDLPFISASKARLQTQWTFDLSTHGSWFGIQTAFLPDPHFAIQVGADFLSVLGTPEPNSDFGQDAITKYLSNDRVYGGLSYVF